MPNYTILLPPSEGKAPGGDDCRNWIDIAADCRLNAFREMDLPRRAVINALQASLSQPTDDLSKLFSVKGERLDEAIATNGKLPAGPLMPAINRYSGVMFDFLDYGSMAKAEQAAFDQHAILFSGLWGLLRPTDLIPDYKLKMDASLPSLGKVSAFWKPLVSALLNPMLDDMVVWDLLPGAHRAAWDGKAAMRRAGRSSLCSGVSARASRSTRPSPTGPRRSRARWCASSASIALPRRTHWSTLRIPKAMSIDQARASWTSVAANCCLSKDRVGRHL